MPETEQKPGFMNCSMAMPLPEPFSFEASEWELWFKRFERFREVSGLCNQPEPMQCSTLIYNTGSKAEEFLASLHLTDIEQKTYKTLTKKIGNFFVPRCNVVFERVKFNQRKQQQGESADLFIASLHTLAAKCEYGDLRDSLIRDRIIVGIRDAELSKRLQMDEKLTLQTCINKVTQSEMIGSQQATVRDKETKPVDFLSSRTELLC